jgi:predicted DNA-binding transcriptional regulator AlpA
MGIAANTKGHFLNEREVAGILAVSVASIRRWRLLNQGPKFLKIGASVRYRPEDVDAWLDSRPSGGGSSGK